MEQFVSEKIVYNEMRMAELKEENDKLRQQLKNKKGINTIDKWKGFEFESSAGETEEFAAFVRDLKKHIKSQLPEGSNLSVFSKGHFEVHGFIERDSKYVYFSISDVRYFSDGWYDDVLIRTAEDVKDYTGGSNGYTSLKDFKKNVNYLLTR